MKWVCRALRPGDMLRVLASGVWHYGIYVSDDEVIQFGKPPRGEAVPASSIRVCSGTIEEFAGGDMVLAADLSLGERLKSKARENRILYAREHLGDAGYHSIDNNCEHFAYMCVFRKAESEQAQKAIELADQQQNNR